MHIKRNRRCVACREEKQQHEMLRLARINNEYLIDEKHNKGGRGAYVCLNSNCIALTIKKRLFNKSFKSNIDVKIYEQMGDYVNFENEN